jgi:hypothetical protein
MKDVLALLADVNPVQAEDVGSLVFPSNPARRSPPTGRLVLALVLVVLGAVGAVAVYGFSVSERSGSTGSEGPTGALGPPPPTVNHPIDGVESSLPAARDALGAPVVVPDASLMGSPAAGPVWLSASPLDTIAAVTYPAANLWIDYWAGVNTEQDDVLLLWRGLAHQDSPMRVVDIDGVPALVGTENSQGSNPGVVMFQVDGIRVEMVGHQDDSTMQALAQSIISGYPRPPAGQLGDVGGVELFTYFPPARRIDLATASATLGAPVVLPDTPLASHVTAGAVWSEHTCPAPTGRLTDEKLLNFCRIWISFPSTGLRVGYMRQPPYKGTRGEWELQARHYGDNAAVVDLGNVPALAIEPEDPYPGSVEFDLDGTRIFVAGNYDAATLESVAQSIVDRSK